jgi:capsular exopolysaccharide synthesis family protein
VAAAPHRQRCPRFRDERENLNVELREYVRALRRRWLWLLVPVVVAAAISGGLSATQKPAYKSTMLLFVTTSTSDPQAQLSRLNSYIALLTGPRVAAGVIRQLGLPITPAEMQTKITAQVQDGTDLLQVTGTDESSAQSKAIVTAATASLVSLAKELDPPPAAGAQNNGNPVPQVSVAQDVVTTQAPSNLVRNVGFSIALGLLIGAAAVALREATRRTVHEEADLRRLGIGTVGMISLGSRYGRNGHPDEALAEGFRRLRSLLPDVGSTRQDGARGTSLVLTGANSKEGTTAVACGLAIAMAETGSKVLLVDGNLRDPGLGRYLDLDENSPGLSDVLTGTARLTDVLQDSLDGRLTVLPSGQRLPDPGEVLASPNLAAAMRALTDRFDIVLVDSPGMHGVADAAVLSKASDSTMLVVRANHSRTSEIERTIDTLEKIGARLAGAVLNALPRKLPTGTAWQSVNPIGGHGESALMSGLFGDTPANQDGPSPDETALIPTTRPPAQGRARVVQSTFVSDTDNDDNDGDEAGDSRFAARGQARVVVITDARPAAGSVPAPRASDDDGADDEEHHSGE